MKPTERVLIKAALDAADALTLSDQSTDDQADTVAGLKAAAEAYDREREEEQREYFHVHGTIDVYAQVAFNGLDDDGDPDYALISVSLGDNVQWRTDAEYIAEDNTGWSGDPKVEERQFLDRYHLTDEALVGIWNNVLPADSEVERVICEKES